MHKQTRQFKKRFQTNLFEGKIINCHSVFRAKWYFKFEEFMSDVVPKAM